MTPAFHEADYYLALRRARRAWEASQPQYVIPGFWNGLDDASLTARRLVGVAGKQQGGRDASSSPRNGLEEVDVARADGKPPTGRLSGVSAAASISSSPSPVPPHTSPGAGSPL